MKWLVNIALACTLVFLAGKIYQVWTQEPVRPGDGESAPAEQRSGRSSRQPPVRRPPLSRFDAIAEKNLFTKERREPSSPDAPVDPKSTDQSRYARKIALYGVVIRDGTRTALVGTVRSRRSPNASTWVRVGDAIDRVTVVGIETDRIYVEEGSATFEVKLDDRNHPLKRVRAKRPDKATIVSTRQDTPSPSQVPSRVREDREEAREAPKPEAAPGEAPEEDEEEESPPRTLVRQPVKDD